MKRKMMTCVGNKTVLALYKKQDWWKSYVKYALAQKYQNVDFHRIDQNSREVKRHKLGILFCNYSIDTLSRAFLWRNTVEGYNFWRDQILLMHAYGHSNASDKYVYTYPLNDLRFLP